MTDEKKTNPDAPAVKAPQGIPALIDPNAAAPIILSQTPPMTAGDARQVRPSSVIASSFLDKK